MKKFILSLVFFLGLFPASYSATYLQYNYQVNDWDWVAQSCTYFAQANMKCWRIMLDWNGHETSDNNYDFTQMNLPLDNAYTNGCKLSLCIFDSPYWARSSSNIMLSYSPAKYAEFVTAALQYCHSRHPGIVVAVEVENEWPTANDASVGQAERDPSWYYADILKAAWQAVQAFNSAKGQNVLTVIDGIWYSAYHHIDELYQLGCRGYFDRVNFHYYLIERNPLTDAGRPENPADTTTVWNFITNIKYIKYLLEMNNEPDMLVWLTEYGWRITDQTKQANYSQYIVDTCRKSGFIDLVGLYLGSQPSGGDTDMSAIIRPSTLKPLYNMYKTYGAQYPSWNPGYQQTLTPLPAASQRIKLVNPNFEYGNLTGWGCSSNTLTLDSSVKHSGSYSGRVTSPEYMFTDYYPVESGRLYEVLGWLKLDSPSIEASHVNLTFNEMYNGTGETVEYPQNYSGIVDTRNYPGGWRKFRYMIFTKANKNQLRILFDVDGSGGTMWVDDLQVNPLNFSTATVTYSDAALVVDTNELNFGELFVNRKKYMNFNIRNAGDTGSTLTGTITADKPWIRLDVTTFSGNNVNVKVIADNTILKQSSGTYSGTISINSNGGNQSIAVKIDATCVLVRPNPVYPGESADGRIHITFFGDGIVPGQTTIKIYTLSGEPVKKADNFQSETCNLQLDLKPGIYLYTYESPREKGTGKFTVLKR